MATRKAPKKLTRSEARKATHQDKSTNLSNLTPRQIQAAAKAQAAQAKAEKKKASKEAALVKSKTKKEADAATKVRGKAEVMSSLPALAKEINTRILKSDRASTDMINHRVALALRLAEAKDVCTAAGHPFKIWVTENINERDYIECTKLARIGKSDDPVAMIEDMRVKSKERMAKSRNKQVVQRCTTQPETPDVRARVALDAMKDEAQVDLITAVASSHGLEMVTLGNSRNGNGVDQIKSIFAALAAKDQMMIATWSANEVGLVINDPFEQKKAPKQAKAPAKAKAAPVPSPTRDATVDELTAIPASMRR